MGAKGDDDTLQESPAKRPKTDAKAAIRELEKQKKEAAKKEDFAQALRLKEEIERLQAALPEPKAKAAPGKKRERSPAKNESSAKKLDAKKAAELKELQFEPFFDDKRPQLLEPGSLTACEREAFRAVNTGNIEFLRKKLAGHMPLCTQRDMASRQTALHLAIERANTKAIGAIGRAISRQHGWPDRSLRSSSLQEQGTGEMNVLTLGFATGKVGAARGGREMNNALLDSKEGPESLDEVVARSPLSEEQVKLLFNFGMLTRMPRIRRGKLLKTGRQHTEGPYVSLDACVEPAVSMGNLSVLQALLSLIDDSYGVTETHRAAVSDTALSDRLQGRSILAQMRIGGQLSPVHFAAINPDTSKLQTMLKREPAALTHAAPGGLQAIHAAAACVSPDPLRLLLSEWQADRKALGPLKRTPLHFAAKAGRPANVRLIMGATAGPCIAFDFAKEIRILLARQAGNKLKIDKNAIQVLSQLLGELLRRIATAGGLLWESLPEVLEGKGLLQQIKEMAKKAGTTGSAPIKLARALSEFTEDALKDMFDRIDTNSDDSIDRNELKVVLESCGIKIGKKTVPELFKRMDKDNSGGVSFDEFSAWIEQGSSYAKALRASLMAKTGDMEHAEVMEAEEQEKELQESDKLVFSAGPVVRELGISESDGNTEYASAILECVCMKVLEVSANATLSQKKTTISSEKVVSCVQTNEELKGLSQVNSVALNSVLLLMKDKEGYTPLHYAAEGGHLECLDALIACGADVNLAGPERKSPLALASERGRSDCVKRLISAGAKLEAGDKRRRTALLLAVRAGQAVTASILLRQGADPNSADDSGNTVAHYAAAFGWTECLELLHEAGADLSASNQMKLAPITAALQKGHRSTFRRMLDMGIDVNFRDADGVTLLLNVLGSAADRTVLEEVQFMLSRGADPSLASATKVTALHKLAQAGLGSKPQHNAYAPSTGEARRLQLLQGWSARPEPENPDAQEEDDPDEEEDADEEEASENEGRQRKRSKKAESNQAPEKDLSEKVFERGFHQLSSNEHREAIFRLGFTNTAWQRGDNPTVEWSDLDAEKQQAARTLGLDESSWQTMPVRVCCGVRDSKGELQFRNGWATGHNTSVEGEVRVVFYNEGAKEPMQESVHISRILLKDESAESQFEHISVAIAKLLLDKKAEPNALDANGVSPLMLTLGSQKTDLALLLLERKADACASSCKEVPGQAGKKEHMTTLLYAAKQTCITDPLKALSMGTWPMHVAVSKLVEKGAVVTAPASQDTKSAIVQFAKSEDFASASVLLQAKADPRADASRRNALHYAMKHVFTSSLGLAFSQELLASPAWGTALITELAGENPHESPLISVTETFAGLRIQADRHSINFGASPSVKMVQVLLTVLQAVPASASFAVWARPTEGRTLQSPLSFVCGSPLCDREPDLMEKVVKLLCQRGVDPDGVPGCPAAVHSLVEKLGERLADSLLVKTLLPLSDLKAEMTDGFTMLTKILHARWQQGAGQQAPTGKPSRMAFGLRSGLRFGAPSAFGGGAAAVGSGGFGALATSAPPTTRATEQILASVKLLLEARCDANQPRRSGPTPLHYSALLRHEGLLDALIAARANPNAKDELGRTPLHNAVMTAPTDADANFDAEDILISAGADVAALDDTRRSPLHYAFMKKNEGADRFIAKDECRWTRQQATIDGSKRTLTEWGPEAQQILNRRLDPIETVSSLCAVKGINVNAKDWEGMSALHLAALRGSSISALKLISAGAQLEDEFAGNTALGLAIQKYPETAVLLMQRGACTTTRCQMIGGQGCQIPVHGKPETTFSLGIRQVGALQNSNPTEASGFLGASISALDCGFPRTEALNDAISTSQFVMLKTLIPKVGDDVLLKLRFDGNQNLLHRLASADRSKASELQLDAMLLVARKLLDRRMPLDADDLGSTPLHLAATANFVSLVTLILERASDVQQLVNAEDSSGCSALGRAFSKCFSKETLQIAELLVAKGASVSRVLVDAGKPLLTYCIQRNMPLDERKGSGGDRTFAEVLFSSTVPDVLMVDADGRTCLMAAAASGGHLAEKYFLLLMRYAQRTNKIFELLTCKDLLGRTALMHATCNGHIAFMNELLHTASYASKDVLRQLLTSQDANGCTILSLAVQSPDPVGAVCVVLRWMEDDVVGPAMRVCDVHGSTVLAQAVLRNNLPVVKALLAGRPLQPKPSRTTCPPNRMAGDKVLAYAKYENSRGGLPRFAVSWLSGDEIAQVQSSDEEFPKGMVLNNVLTIAIPPGIGPGMDFSVSWDASTGGPGAPALAGGYAGDMATPRTPAEVLGIQDAKQRTLLHCCIAPLPFGSYENVEMLACLVTAGVPIDVKDSNGAMASELASRQKSGRMLQCLGDLGVAVPAKVPLVEMAAGAWPDPVDPESDCAAALASAQAAMTAVGIISPAAPADKNFKPPSASSRVQVSDGPDGKPLDLVMTKVDVAQGPFGQNVFYRMQVLHEMNQDNFFLFTRWGRTGESGQFQCSPFESLEKATTEFCKIFKSKSGNEWLEREQFDKKTGKYQLHEIKYSAVKAQDALKMATWKKLPAKSTPAPLQRLLAVCTEPGLLANVLASTTVDQPLGLLKRKPLEHAQELLQKIKILVQRVGEERQKSQPSGSRLQELADDIAKASNVIYELVPTRNFRHENVSPIDSIDKVKQWIARLHQTEDIACAARLLLGAQARIADVSPLDYLYSALNLSITPLAHNSLELQLLEQYICSSAPNECMLFCGDGAQPLPQPQPGKVSRPKWSAISDVQCYADSACLESIPLIAPAGYTYVEYDSDQAKETICIKLDYVHRSGATASKYAKVWVRPCSPNQTALVRLSDREAVSRVAAVYRVERRGEESWPGSTLLYHGSGLANCLSILSQGLRVQPPGVQLHGAAFGNGVYFANTFCKSRSYCGLHQGVGFMLLCEVSLGKVLPCSGDFCGTVREARLAAARERLGLPAGAKTSEHPELKRIAQELREEASSGRIEDISGTGFDSLHFQSGQTPDASGTVVHPAGCEVPCGHILSSDGTRCQGGGRDELIVYETSRARVRYVLELRDLTEPQALRDKPEQNQEEEFPPPNEVEEEEEDDEEEDDEDGDDDEDEE
eukprot:TRINITY_DN23788_c0_g2_i1.p1 TRINITY_DN23788_c0_g2~~TRINITY_DN23788_c0_g2_i1.p1  ORF type:complete len:3105 (-),score=585.98 TRINITY_DN23788_c0_g2_i1:231-9545(-)